MNPRKRFRKDADKILFDVTFRVVLGQVLYQALEFVHLLHHAVVELLQSFFRLMTGAS